MWVEVLKLLNNHRIFYDNSESLIASELLEILKRCLLATASSSWILNKWSYWSCCNNSGIHMASPINTGNCYDSFYTALYACFKYRRNYEFLEILMKCKANDNTFGNTKPFRNFYNLFIIFIEFWVESSFIFFQKAKMFAQISL